MLDGLPGIVIGRSSTMSHFTKSYQGVVRHAAERQAVRIMIALNRYRATNTKYPAQLEALAPDFINALPVDPFCDRLFGYRLESPDRYTLYSCGPDGDDDGGSPSPDADGSRTEFAEAGDLIYTRERGEPELEPKLRPASLPSASSRTTDGDRP